MTDRLDDKISAFVLELVDDPPPAPEIDFEAKHTPVLHPLRRVPPQRRTPIPVMVGAALLILIAIGVPVLLFSGGDSEVVDEPDTTTTAPPPTTDAPSPLALPDTWQRVGAEAMNPALSAALLDMTLTELGLVAVGFDRGEEDYRPNGAVFMSADGVTWTRLGQDAPELSLGDILIFGVTDGGPGIVAVGMSCEDDAGPCMSYPTVWTSSDGVSWNRSAADPDVFGVRGAVMDVISGEQGMIAAGGYLDGDDPETALFFPGVWLSPDGIDWERAWSGESFSAADASLRAGFHALAIDPEGLIVGVGMASANQGGLVAAVWTSTDGRTWERIEPDSPAFAGTNDADVAIHDVAWGPGGFMAVGTDGGSSVAIWRSPDGFNWTRIGTDSQPFERVGSLSSIEPLDTGWVAAGPHIFSDMTGGTATLWTSPDGLIWDRVHSIDSGYAMSLVLADNGIAVAGARTGTDDIDAAVWAGPAFDPAAPPPDVDQAPAPAPDPNPADSPREVVPDASLDCEDLADLGYGYSETISYWLFYDQPNEFDPNGNGTPCEAFFPPDAVEAVFGAPGELSVEVIAGGQGTFSATGPAVDEGLICAGGTMEYVGDAEAHPAAIWRWEHLYTCDDGSGTFILSADEFYRDTEHVTGVWDIARGTGSYASLTGGGGVETTFAEGTIAIAGRVWLTAEGT